MDATVTDTGSPFASARPILAGPSESQAAPLQIHSRETRPTSRFDMWRQAWSIRAKSWTLRENQRWDAGHHRFILS